MSEMLGPIEKLMSTSCKVFLFELKLILINQDMQKNAFGLKRSIDDRIVIGVKYTYSRSPETLCQSMVESNLQIETIHFRPFAK